MRTGLEPVLHHSASAMLQASEASPARRPTCSEVADSSSPQCGTPQSPLRPTSATVPSHPLTHFEQCTCQITRLAECRRSQASWLTRGERRRYGT